MVKGNLYAKIKPFYDSEQVIDYGDKVMKIRGARADSARAAQDSHSKHIASILV